MAAGTLWAGGLGLVTSRSCWLLHHCEYPKTTACQRSPQNLWSDIVKESSCWGWRHVRKRSVLRKKRKQSGGDMWTMPSLRTWLETHSWKEALPDRGEASPWDWGCLTPVWVHPWGPHTQASTAMGDSCWCRGKQLRNSKKTLGWWHQPAASPVTSLVGLGGCGTTCSNTWYQVTPGRRSHQTEAEAGEGKDDSINVHLTAFLFSILESVIKCLH